MRAKTRFEPNGSPLEPTHNRLPVRRASFAREKAHCGQAEENPPPFWTLNWTEKLPFGFCPANAIVPINDSKPAACTAVASSCGTPNTSVLATFLSAVRPSMTAETSGDTCVVMAVPPDIAGLWVRRGPRAPHRRNRAVTEASSSRQGREPAVARSAAGLAAARRQYG